MSSVQSGHHRPLRAAAVALACVLLALGWSERLPGSAAQAVDPPAAPASVEQPAPPDRARLLESIARTPLHFERNVGQTEASIDFLANGAGYRVALSAGRATVAVGGQSSDARAIIGLVPRGARRPQGVATDDLPGTVAYYRGTDPASWYAGVSTHARVTYAGVYDGIDLVYYGNQRRLQYDFIVHPGAEPSAIAMGVEGVDRLDVNAEGQLLMRVGERTMVQDRPFTYQEFEGARHEVASRFIVDGHAVRFEVGDYDRTRPLVIDPVIVYSSWFGGSGEEGILAMEVDSAGDLVVFGFTQDLNSPLPFPTTPGAMRTTRTDNDAFVSKFNASGSTLLFSTLIGGSGDDVALAYNYVGGMALDGANAIYITGTTRSADFPTTVGAHDTDFNDDDAGATGTADGFYVKLSSTGALQYGTYFGGRRVDEPHGIDVDAAGNVYIVGSTDSDTSLGATGGFAVTALAYQPSYQGAGDLFLVGFSPSGGLTYATYLGGSGSDAVNASDVKASRTTPNVVYIVSDTSSSNFPTTPATRLQGFATGPDAVVLRLDLSQATPANQLTYGTFFGGNGTDFLTALAVDETDTVYVGGATNSSTASLPTAVTPAGTPSPSGTDVLVAKFDPSKSGAASLVYGMRVNGFYTDTGTDIVVDSAGRAWVGVDSSSFQATPTATDFPLKNTLSTARSGNGVHQAVIQVNAAGNDLMLSSLIGGSAGRGGPVALALTPVGDLWVGATSGGGTSQLALVAPFQGAYGGGDADATLQRIGNSADLSITKTANPALPTTVLPGQTLTYTIVVTNPSTDAAFDVVVTDTLPAQVTFQSCNATGGGACLGTGNARTVQFNAINGGTSQTITIVTRVNDDVGAGGTWTNTATVTAGTTDPNPGNNSDGVGSGQPTLSDPSADGDGDGLPNGWEQQYGLNPLSNSFDNGPNGDPDGDGKTNLQELNEGTHPRGFVITFLAEGATGTFFDTRLAIANPSMSPALVLTRFQRGDGTTIRDYRVVPARSRTTIDVEGIGGLEAAEFSTLVEADVQVVVDRTMTWDQNGYGSHAERGILTRTATTWYFAEGATFGNFNLFYLIQNPNSQTAQVQVTYLLPPPQAPLVKTYNVPPQSRFNIWVDAEGANDPALLALANAELSAVVTSTNGVPIVVERAMYLDQPGRVFGAGQESAGVTAPATEWFLAEGATGTYFDLFVLIANPNPTTATVQADYLLDTGQVITRQYSVAGNSRFNIWVDLEDPMLANAALSTRITSLNTVPIIVERSMWWPGPTSASWQEAHNSPGETSTGTRWAMAEGETGGPHETETYVLIANTSPFPGTARVTVLFEDGTAPITRDFPLLASSRSNVAPAGDFPETTGKRFGLLVESVGTTPAQIVVERAMYSNAQGVRWAAGTNTLATRLP